MFATRVAYLATGKNLICSVVQSAAEHDRLGSDTYKRLNVGLAAWGLLSLAKYFMDTFVIHSGLTGYTPCTLNCFNWCCWNNNTDDYVPSAEQRWCRRRRQSP